MSILFVAAVALVDTDKRVLLGQRPIGKSFAGLWEFPGGKIHENESPEAAAVRELREELGIDTDPTCLTPLTFASHAYENFHLLMPLYICHRWRNPVIAQENQALAWVHARDLRKYDVLPADIPLISPLISYLIGL